MSHPRPGPEDRDLPDGLPLVGLGIVAPNTHAHLAVDPDTAEVLKGVRPGDLLITRLQGSDQCVGVLCQVTAWDGTCLDVNGRARVGFEPMAGRALRPSLREVRHLDAARPQLEQLGYLLEILGQCSSREDRIALGRRCRAEDADPEALSIAAIPLVDVTFGSREKLLDCDYPGVRMEAMMRWLAPEIQRIRSTPPGAAVQVLMASSPSRMRLVGGRLPATLIVAAIIAGLGVLRPPGVVAVIWWAPLVVLALLRASWLVDWRRAPAPDVTVTRVRKLWRAALFLEGRTGRGLPAPLVLWSGMTGAAMRGRRDNIYICADVVDTCTVRELAAILAHERGHLDYVPRTRRRRLRLLTAAVGAAILVAVVITGGAVGLSIGTMLLWMAWVAVCLVPCAGAAVLLTLREMEADADRAAVAALGRHVVASALTKVARIETSSAPGGHLERAARAPWVWIATFTHRRLPQRIARLAAMAEESQPVQDPDPASA